MLKGKQVYLQLLTSYDVSDAYVEMLSDPGVVRYLESRFYPQTRGRILSYVEECASNPNIHLYGIFDNAGREHCGNIKLVVNWFHHFGEVGLAIHGNWWNKGFGTEAIELISEWAFKALGLHKLVAGCYSSNPASLRAFMKAGYLEEGRFRAQYWSEGQWVDEVVLSRFGNGIQLTTFSDFLAHESIPASSSGTVD